MNSRMSQLFGKASNSKDKEKDEALTKLAEKISGFENVLKRFIKDSNERMDSMEKKVEEVRTRPPPPPVARPSITPSPQPATSTHEAKPRTPEEASPPQALVRALEELRGAVMTVKTTVQQMGGTVSELSSRVAVLEEDRKKQEAAVPAPKSTKEVGDHVRSDMDKLLAEELWKAHKKTALKVIRNYRKTLEATVGEDQAQQSR